MDLPYRRSRPLSGLSGARTLPLGALVTRALPYALIAVLPIALLAPWLGTTLDRDEGVYITIAMGMRHGLMPYADLFDHKPPLIYAVYWLSLIAGGGVWLPRLLAASFLGAAAIAVTLVARELGLRRAIALAAGALFSLSTSNALLGAGAANTEAFMVLPMTLSLYLLLRGERTDAAAGYFFSGVMAGVALLFKTSCAPVVAVTLLYVLMTHRPRPHISALWFATGAAVVLAGCVAAFAAAGAFHDAWYANVTYNRLYANSTALHERLTMFWTFRRGVLVGGLPFWLLAAAGLALLARLPGRQRWLVAAWAAASYLGIKVTGRDSPHYYVQLLPAAAVLGAVALDGIAASHRRALSVAVLAVPLLLFHAALFAYSVATPQQRAASHALNAELNACTADARDVAAWLHANSAPNERVYNLGRDSAIYYYAGRLPATRFMYDRPFFIDPVTADAAVGGLLATPPSLIVDTTARCSQGAAVPASIQAVLASGYTRAGGVGGVTIYRLNHAAPAP